MLEIREQFKDHGLDPGEIIADGKIHRFNIDNDDHKKSGWYVGFSNYSRKSGELYYVCVGGNYRSGDTFTINSGTAKLSTEDRKAIKEQIETAKKQQEKAREKMHEETAQEVIKKWEGLSQGGTNEYLRKKQIDKVENLGIKFDSEGNFYVPIIDIDGRMYSWEQFSHNGNKRFHTGGRIQGCFHVVGRLSEKVIYFAEGFSTSASVSAGTGAGVVCCLSASNMPHVVSAFRKRYPQGEFIICGDDDKWKDENTGRKIANEVASKSLASVVFPIFKDAKDKLKDFNDLHCDEGIDVVRNQLSKIDKKDTLALYALGFLNGTYFFTSTKNRQISPLTSFSEDALLRLMPIEYWEAVFPGGGKARVDWSVAKSSIISQCHKKGIFNGNKVRGLGVWQDAGRVVVHMGDHLVVDGSVVELGEIKSKYIYILKEDIDELKKNILSDEECQIFINACCGFKWAKPKDAGILLAGILVLSRVCGALPIRPHCWITGGAQTGKSTIFEQLINKIMGKNKLYLLGGTSEAAIRQSLLSDAVPVLFDEFETNGPKSAEHINACIELMRASWSNSGGVIAKGGGNGIASYYQVQFSAIVSSIRTRLINDADKGRFTVLELAPHGSDTEHWKELRENLAIIDEEFSERLFARVIECLPIILDNYKLIKVALAKKADSRFGDQYGMILAGYSILISKKRLTKEESVWLADQIELTDEKEVSKQADHDDCLQHLFTTKISFESATGGRREALIEDIIASQYMQAKRNTIPGSMGIDQGEKNALLNLGIRVDDKHISIISSNHAELESRVWRGTKWSQIWGNTLMRLPGAKKQTVRIFGSAKWCVLLSTSFLDDKHK